MFSRLKIVFVASMLLSLPPVSAVADFSDATIAAISRLEGEGYQINSVSRTFLGRVKVKSSNNRYQRETIFHAVTMEIIQDRAIPVAPSDGSTSSSRALPAQNSGSSVSSKATSSSNNARSTAQGQATGKSAKTTSTTTTSLQSKQHTAEDGSTTTTTTTSTSATSSASAGN
jgi:cell division septation protein DedD